MQEYTSAATSINKNKVPKLFTVVDKHFGWKPLTINLDLGGGKYDTATEYLAEKDVKNYILDPYNRSEEHNEIVHSLMYYASADTVTISNVLNVVKGSEARYEIILEAWSRVKPGGTIYISVYNSGKAGESKRGCWQNAMTLERYLKEITDARLKAYIKHGIIIIKDC
jgi:2-polyprenyl-3-methyl-5-hydroxy-6-metoxy-1,4-benzoquinol methylase